MAPDLAAGALREMAGPAVVPALGALPPAAAERIVRNLALLDQAALVAALPPGEAAALLELMTVRARLAGGRPTLDPRRSALHRASPRRAFADVCSTRLAWS